MASKSIVSLLSCCILSFVFLGIAMTGCLWFLASQPPNGCGPWEPIDWKSLQADTADVIHIKYLVAPLKCEFGNKFALVDAYHGAIAFTNVNSGKSWTMNYDATPSFGGAMLPTVTTKDGTTYLSWQNGGAVFIYNDINQTFWSTVDKEVGKMNGLQFNQFMQWISQYNGTYPYYNLWTAYSAYPGEKYIPSNDCFEFVWKSLRKVKELGGTVYPTHLQQSIITLYVKEKPKKVDVSDSAQYSAVVSFYSELSKEINKSGLLGLLDVVKKMVFDDQFIIRSDKDYYSLDLKEPWASILWDDVPIDLPSKGMPAL